MMHFLLLVSQQLLASYPFHHASLVGMSFLQAAIFKSLVTVKNPDAIAFHLGYVVPVIYVLGLELLVMSLQPVIVPRADP